MLQNQPIKGCLLPFAVHLDHHDSWSITLKVEAANRFFLRSFDVQRQKVNLLHPVDGKESV
jgi:hypothetical protein